jgi:hypothetical protein
MRVIAFVLVLGTASLAGTAANAACSWTMLTNGNTANADQVMNNFDCLAPMASPSFTGYVGIGTTSAGASIDIRGSTPEIRFTASGTNGETLRFYASDNSERGVIRFDSGKNLQLETAGTEKMRLTAGGNVGVGITAPQTMLDVNGGLRLNQANGGNGAASLIELSGRQTGWSMGINWNLYYDGAWRYRNSDYGAGIGLGDGTNQGDIIFATTPNGTAGASATINQRMRITNAGNVGIGTSSPAYTLHVNGSVAGTSAYNNLSDARLKKNVTPIGNALSKVDALQGVYFDWRRRGERPIGHNLDLPAGARQIGFLAQDLAKVLPEAVSTAKDGDHTLSVAESKIVPLLVEAVKELHASNRRLQEAAESQSGEIARLRGEIAGLKRGRVARLQGG